MSDKLVSYFEKGTKLLVKKTPYIAERLIQYCKKNPDRTFAIFMSGVAGGTLINLKFEKEKHKKELNLVKGELIKVNCVMNDAVKENEFLSRDNDILIKQNIALYNYISLDSGDNDEN